MKCPYCIRFTLLTKESRPAEVPRVGQSQRRRRACAQCKRRFTTIEVIEKQNRELLDKLEELRARLAAIEKSDE